MRADRAAAVGALALLLSSPGSAHAALPSALQHSNGASYVSTGTSYGNVIVRFTGWIKAGSGVFHGTAYGGYTRSSAPQFGLYGLASTGDLVATCLDRSGVSPPYDEQSPLGAPTAGTITCVGHVGGEPDAAFTLYVVYPVATVEDGYHEDTTFYEGRFAG